MRGSASHYADLLDAGFDVLPEPQEEIEEPEVMLTENDEAEEDESGPDYTVAAGASIEPATKRVRRLRSHWGIRNVFVPSEKPFIGMLPLVLEKLLSSRFR